jgi:hypothetical protein
VNRGSREYSCSSLGFIDSNFRSIVYSRGVMRSVTRERQSLQDDLILDTDLHLTYDRPLVYIHTYIHTHTHTHTHTHGCGLGFANVSFATAFRQLCSLYLYHVQMQRRNTSNHAVTKTALQLLKSSA